jgi:membrane-associated phospholipid phosphatase
VLQQILNWDYKLFEWIHIGCQNVFFDFLLPFTRNKYFWAPVYLFLAAFMYEQFGKKSLVWMLGFFVTFALCDFTSASIIKPLFHRTRPCNDSMWFDVYRQLVPRSHGFSFPSSHATNHYGLASFIVITLGHFSKKIKWIAFAWASLIGFAQIYVGMHYPLDILGGILIGIWIGNVIGNYSNHNTFYA